MSCQRGNASRSRSQKHQNHTAFKNNLHDNSRKTKFINNLEIANVCERCKSIIEWKIKYKKYKALKAPAKCRKCEQKTVKHAYHNICLPCAKQGEVCPKCGEKEEIVAAKPNKEEQLRLDAELRAILKAMPERKRRTFLRYVNQKSKKDSGDQNNSEFGTDVTKNDCKDTGEDATGPRSREDLLLKLKSLAVTEKEEDDNFDSDIDDDSNSYTDDRSCDEESLK